MKKSRWIVLLTLWIFVTLNIRPISATQSTVDITFGIQGQVRTDLGGSYDWAYASVLQYDGKIVVAGVSNSKGTYDFALVRYNSNGSLDQNFGNQGITLTDFNNSTDWAYAIVIQPDAKIIVAGTSNNHLALARYMPNGILDMTFGDKGLVTNSLRPLTTDIVHGITLQPDGKILIAGVTILSTVTLNPEGDFLLARYLTNGSLDPSFGVGGISTTDFDTGSYDEANTLALQPDGAIILGGYSNHRGSDALYGPDHLALARYTNNGSLDSTFADNGKLVINGGSIKEAINSVIIAPDKTIIIGGFVNGEKRGDLFLARLQDNGKILNISITDLGTNSERISSLTFHLNGDIIAGGQVALHDYADFAIFRYDPKGHLEDVSIADFEGRESRIHSVLVQPDGKIVAVGQSETDFALTRFIGGK